MLKTVLETLDGIDDAAKPFYAEADGKYVLQVDGVDNHPDVANLKNAYDRVKADKAKLAEERDALKSRIAGIPDDFDPEKWKNRGKADPQDLVELRKTLEAERDEWKGKFDTLKGDTEKRAIRDAVQAALAAQNVPEGARRGAALDMMDGRKVELQDGNPMIDTDMGPMNISEYAKRWVAKEGQGYIPKPTGGGAKGNEGGGGAGSKTASRSDFEAMSQSGRAAFIKEGGKVIEAP